MDPIQKGWASHLVVNEFFLQVSDRVGCLLYMLVMDLRVGYVPYGLVMDPGVGLAIINIYLILKGKK